MSDSVEAHILKAKQDAAEDMYEALQRLVIEAAQLIKLLPQRQTVGLILRHNAGIEALNKATYIVRPMCGNCDAELPKGCGGEFSDEPACKLNGPQ